MQPVLSIQSLWLLLPLVRKIIRAREESLQSLHWYRTWKRTLEGVNPSLKCQVRLSYPRVFPTAEQRRGACARATLRPPLSPPTPSPLSPPAPRRIPTLRRCAHGILKVNSVATASSAASRRQRAGGRTVAQARSRTDRGPSRLSLSSIVARGRADDTLASSLPVCLRRRQPAYPRVEVTLPVSLYCERDPM